MHSLAGKVWHRVRYKNHPSIKGGALVIKLVYRINNFRATGDIFVAELWKLIY